MWENACISLQDNFISIKDLKALEFVYFLKTILSHESDCTEFSVQGESIISPEMGSLVHSSKRSSLEWW